MYKTAAGRFESHALYPEEMLEDSNFVGAIRRDWLPGVALGEWKVVAVVRRTGSPWDAETATDVGARETGHRGIGGGGWLDEE